ncbi:unnamed protein product [Sphagnum balticum]
MDWVYAVPAYCHFFVAEDAGIHLYKLDEEKKIAKEVKMLSGKYHCYLYEPISEFLVAFPYGDCDTANTFIFEPSRGKNWFRGSEIGILTKPGNEEYYIDIIRIQSVPYMAFYYPDEGKLKLTPMLEQSDKKEVTIKLPSDSLPKFNVVDNMLVIHLKNEKITFLYDVNADDAQTLVSPFPLLHSGEQDVGKLYSAEFLGRRVYPPKEVLKLLMKNQRVKEAKRYIKMNHEKMEVLDLLEFAHYIKSVDIRREFVKFARFFIQQKYPAMNPLYIDEAEKKLFQ